MSGELDRSRRLIAQAKRDQRVEELLELLPQGHGSGLDADMVDGKHAVELVAMGQGGSGGGGGGCGPHGSTHLRSGSDPVNLPHEFTVSIPRQSVAGMTYTDCMFFKLQSDKKLRVWTLGGRTAGPTNTGFLILRNVTDNEEILKEDLYDPVLATFKQGNPYFTSTPLAADKLVAIRLYNMDEATRYMYGFISMSIEDE